MKRRLFGVVVVAVMVVMPLSQGVAFADPSSRPPVGPPEHAEGTPTYESDDNCPAGGGWIEVTPSGPEHLSAAYDHNRDGEVCGRLLAPGGFTLMDNVVR